MIKELMHDPIFLAGKSEVATKEDLQIAQDLLDTEALITHTYLLSKIDEAYELFENKRDGIIKVAVEC